MELVIQFNKVLLIVCLTVSVRQATIVQRTFHELEEGQNFTGKKAAVVSARSNIKCSTMCLADYKCKFYQFTGTGPGNCLLIHSNTTEEDGQIFSQNGVNSFYGKVCSQTSNGLWNAPCEWTGPDAVLYESFDSSEGYVLMEGNAPSEMSISLVSGWVNSAWTVTHTKRQWINLGIHINACMTRPETCGAAGGAFSMWVKVIECIRDCGIVSSHGGFSGFMYYVHYNDIRVTVFLSDGRLEAVYPTIPAGWTHVVMNYIHGSPDEIVMSIDGEEVASDSILDSYSITAGDGRIVVGRLYTHHDSLYSSVQVDEMFLFDQSLKSNYSMKDFKNRKNV